MKKLLVIVLCIAFATLTVACVANASSSSTPPEQQPSTLPTGPEDGNLPVAPADPAQGKLPNPTQLQDPLPTLADTALYRGTVTATAPDVDAEGKPTLVLTLAQAEGTDYGAATLQFVISDNSSINFALEPVEELTGKYMEAYYGVAMGQAADYTAVQNAIQVIQLAPEAAMVNSNVVVVSVDPSADKEGEGQILVTNLAGDEGSQVLFNYGPETQFYLNQAGIKTGDKLNIYHSAAMTRSLPPQCAAYEIRAYKAPTNA